MLQLVRRAGLALTGFHGAQQISPGSPWRAFGHEAEENRGELNPPKASFARRAS
jgi:hypothetical protein